VILADLEDRLSVRLLRETQTREPEEIVHAVIEEMVQETAVAVQLSDHSSS
jgi:hypothetical protein